MYKEQLVFFQKERLTDANHLKDAKYQPWQFFHLTTSGWFLKIYRFCVILHKNKHKFHTTSPYKLLFLTPGRGRG